MADFKENIVTGKKYRVCTDASTNSWDRVSMWTSAADVEMADGKSVEKSVSDLTESLNTLSFAQDADGNWGYKVGASTEIHPFKSGFGKLTTIDSGSTQNYTKTLNKGTYICVVAVQNLWNQSGYYPSYIRLNSIDLVDIPQLTELTTIYSIMFESNDNDVFSVKISHSSKGGYNLVTLLKLE